MVSYESLRYMPVSPIQSPRPDPSSSDLTLDASRYEALPSDEREAKPYSKDRLPPLTSIPISPKPRTWSQHLCDRIGYSGLLVLTLGSAVIVISSSILVFLWAGAENARNRRQQPKFWNDIVFNDWSTRVVTICSALIRISLAFQISFITAAISAIMLEASSCRFSDMATLSIQRASSTNASPSTILPAALRQCITSGFLGFCYVLFLSSVFAIALISTFTSTILLSEFRTAHITTPSMTETIPLGINQTLYDRFDELDIGLSSHFKSRPSAHWRFAEAKTSKASPMELSDTGDVYRALLPFSSPEVRASLEYYSGPGLVINHRTLCFAPKLEEIRINCSGSIEMAPSCDFRGTMSLEFGDWGPGPLNISCPIHGTKEGDTDWPLSTCALINPEGETKYIWSEHSRKTYFLYPIMLVNGTTLQPFYGIGENPFAYLRMITTTTEGPWTKAYTINGSRALSATICLVNTVPLPLLSITMSGRPISSEPAVDWRRLSSRENNTGHLRQLGIGLPTDDFASRGILELQIPSTIIPEGNMSSEDTAAFYQHERLVTLALSEKSLSQSWILSNNVILSHFFPWTAHPEHSALVQRVLRLTQDPAQAIHALAFRFSQMLYYAHQPQFNIKRPVTTIRGSKMLVPTQWTGLSVVLATLSVHFIVLTVTAVLFVQCTKASLLGNAWQAVSQIVSPQTREVMDTPSVDSMRDKDVEEWARTTGRDSQVYHLSRAGDRGRTEICLR